METASRIEDFFIYFAEKQKCEFNQTSELLKKKYHYVLDTRTCI
jgi:hypothetical protein